MSGIYGIYSFTNDHVDERALAKMQEAMLHRGPDGMGIRVNKNVGLGQLRLNITPESELETLPFEDDNLVIIGDYRIDNRAELVRELQLTGSNHPVTDCEIIIAAYTCWGEKCAPRLIGDFVFVIFDKVKNELFCICDFLGSKMLVYHRNKDSFFFATEIKAIRATGKVAKELNKEAVLDYLFFNSHQLDTTFFKNIYHLPPAHYMKISRKGIQMEKYWELPKRKLLKLGSDREYSDALLKVFSRAVMDRARTNKPVGSLLSGGLDSSSITCLLARKFSKSRRPMSFGQFSSP